MNHDKIAEIEILWAKTGYWLFNADTYLQYSSTEKWDVIPADKRDTRTTLVAPLTPTSMHFSKEDGPRAVGIALQSYGRRCAHQALAGHYVQMKSAVAGLDGSTHGHTH